MQSRFRRLLLLLVMLALPLQALASAAMLACAVPQADVEHEMAMAGSHGCHDSEAPEMPAPAHDCKHCAACAPGAVLPTPGADRVAPRPAAGSAAHPAAGHTGFIPDGPERPPRPFLA